MSDLQDINKIIAANFIDTDPMGPHRNIPQIERGTAGPGLEGEEYDAMVENLQRRIGTAALTDSSTIKE